MTEMTEIDDRLYSRDTIERYLDRCWVCGRLPLPLVTAYRKTLADLDDWMQRQRQSTLATADASHVSALLDSSRWIDATQSCPGLLGVVMGFYQSLQDCKFRPDDPIEALIDLELLAAAFRHDASRLSGDGARRKSVA